MENNLVLYTFLFLLSLNNSLVWIHNFKNSKTEPDEHVSIQWLNLLPDTGPPSDPAHPDWMMYDILIASTPNGFSALQFQKNQIK